MNDISLRMSFHEPSRSRTSIAPVPRNGIVTHPCLHVRDVHDAQIVLEAVRRDTLPIVRRRLLSNERDDLRSGHVYVWEEAQDEGGLLRWTDGRRWSQSRMRGDYLFYEEKVETTQEERDAKAARRAHRASDPTIVLPTPTRRKDRPSKPNGLTKQTYSVTVHLPGSIESRKWHLVAYFSGNDYTRLPVVGDYDYLRNIPVPHGVFLSSKVIGARTDRFSQFSDESDVHEDSTHIDSLATRHYHSPMASGLISPSLSASSYIPSSPHQHHPHPASLPRGGSQRISLPPITSLGQSTRRPVYLPSHSSPPPNAHYTPLSSEDRRVLDRFRVVL